VQGIAKEKAMHEGRHVEDGKNNCKGKELSNKFSRDVPDVRSQQRLSWDIVGEKKGNPSTKSEMGAGYKRCRMSG